MAWVTPIKTWITGDVLTAAIVNQEWRDRFEILKTPIGNDGRITAINSTYFASLSGANLTSIPETAITDGTLLARLAANETVTGNWTFGGNTLSLIGAGFVLVHRSSTAAPNEGMWFMQALNPGWRLGTMADNGAPINDVIIIGRAAGLGGANIVVLGVPTRFPAGSDAAPGVALGVDGEGIFRFNPALGGGVGIAGGNLALNGNLRFFGSLPTTASPANLNLGIPTSDGRVLRESTSTRTAKKNIQPLTLEQARKLLLVEPVTFHGLHADDDREWAGFIAEDVHEVIPTLVTYGADGLPNYVTYDRIPAYLLALTKHHESQLEALTARLTALEAR